MLKKLKQWTKMKTLGIVLLALMFVVTIFLSGCSKPKDGQDGTTWYSGTESPTYSSYPGKLGDFYLDEDDFIIYKYTQDGWVEIGNFQGGQGQDGQDGQDGQNGTSFLTGESVPSDYTGNVGDVYLNMSNYDLYKKIDASTWSLIGNIKGQDGQNGEDGQDGQDGQPGQAGQDGQNGQDGQDGKDGSQFLSGALDPQADMGNDGDVYLNTMSSDLYQKVDGAWTLIANIRGETGENGITPHIGENGNWWVGEEDTGYPAVNESGESSLVSVDEEGYLIIDGENTGYCLNLTAQELYLNLQGIIEFDGGETGFKSEFESVEGYEFNSWEFTTSTFSGWAGLIGKPEEINAIKFRVRARDTAITKISVMLAENDKAGEIVARKILDVDVQPYEEKDIVWILDETITNSNNINYFFGYSCNAFVDKYGKCGTQGIPDEYISENTMTLYCTNGELKYDFDNFSKTEGADGHIYAYIPVQVGNVAGTFKISNEVIEEVLSHIESELYKNSDIILPSTIYGYVGQTMQIYFRNIIAYPTDDIYIKVNTSKGKQYADRWEYTPETAEEFDLTISLFSKNWTEISESKFNVVIKDTTTKNSARALVIGDSTVYAGTETSKMVSLSETDENFDLTLIGTLGTGTNKHEGRGGWTANGYVTNSSTEAGENGNPFYNPDTQTFDFSYYMTQNGYATEGVDVVFIQLGINDIFSRDLTNLHDAIKLYTTSLQTMIDSIHAYNPSIKVVLNLIIPCDTDQNSFTDTYGTSQTVWGYMRNMYLANQALLSTFASQENVYLSWYNASLDSENNQGGNVHPNTDGYNQLGTQMYYMLKAIL